MVENCTYQYILKKFQEKNKIVLGVDPDPSDPKNLDPSPKFSNPIDSDLDPIKN